MRILTTLPPPIPIGIWAARPIPSTLGVQPVSGGFPTRIEIAYGNLVGGIPEATSVSNYNVDKGGATGTLLPDGTFINRHFKANEFEWYMQDCWRARPNLTITFGITAYHPADSL